MPAIAQPPKLPPPGASLRTVAAALDLSRAVAVLTESQPRRHAAALERRSQLEARWMADATAAAAAGPIGLPLSTLGPLPSYLRPGPEWCDGRPSAGLGVKCPVCAADPGLYCGGLVEVLERNGRGFASGLPHGQRIIKEAKPEGYAYTPPEARPSGGALLAAQRVGPLPERFAGLLEA